MTATIRRHKNFIPILLLAGLCLWTTFEILFIKFEIDSGLYDRSFSRANFLAFIAVILNICSYYFARKYFKYLVIATVALGFIGILNFTANTYVVHFIIPFQPIALLTGLLYLMINYERIKTRLDRPNDPNTEAAPDLEKVEEFKNKYRQKTTEELVEISNDRRFVTEAKIASNDLIIHRTKEAEPIADRETFS